MKKVIMALGLSLLPLLCWANVQQQAHLVLVQKSARKLSLIRNGKAIKEYSISLGENPVGHKVEEGDKRTPEGVYILDWRKKSDRYFRSIHISYPNQRDMGLAVERGVDPGGMIMIHGIPPLYNRVEKELKERDWTDGCIAVTNEEMTEIWNSVPDGTPIYILP
jgi:murein L,D-transpeptidase YafK